MKTYLTWAVYALSLLLAVYCEDINNIITIIRMPSKAHCKQSRAADRDCGARFFCPLQPRRRIAVPKQGDWRKRNFPGRAGDCQRYL